MKTKNLLLAVTLLFSLSLFAEHVPLLKARTVALNFYFEKHNQYEGAIDFSALQISEMFTQKNNQEPVYYVFGFTNGGFVIVSADDRLNPVIGYSFKNDFVHENQPPNVKWWYQQYEDQVLNVREKQIEPEKRNIDKWTYYLSENIISEKIATSSKEVEILLTTEWNQGFPENYYCPETSNGGSGGHVWASCVVAAVAQIGYYWRWPDHGQGYTSYIPKTHPEYGVQSANFENTWYRFDEMVDNLTNVNTAIAEYIYHIVANYHTDFTPNASQPDSSIYLPGNDSTYYHFKFLPTTWIYRDSMPDDEWKTLLVNMLDKAYPIFYGGYENDTLGHSFVCDGYQDEDHFHFNLGWGGQSNGYYSIDNIIGYNYHQLIFSASCPDTIQFNYPIYATGTDTLRALEGSIADGSGPIHNYLNNAQASWFIDPQNEMDSVTNIALHIKRCHFGNGDYLRIYDGNDNTAPLLAEVTGDAYPEELVSTGNKVFVEFTSDSENKAQGFYLVYQSEVPTFCSGQKLVNDTIKRFDDGSGNFYYQNNQTCQWFIQPEGCDSSLTLYFDFFDTETEKDFLKIVDLQTQEVLAEYSGFYENPPPPVVSLNGSMLLIFVTNKSERGKGWSAYYGNFTGIDEIKNPLDFSIFPNPFATLTSIEYEADQSGNIELKIYSQLGELIEVIQKNSQTGKQKLRWNASGLPSGVYFIRLQIDDKVVTKKIIKTR